MLQNTYFASSEKHLSFFAKMLFTRTPRFHSSALSHSKNVFFKGAQAGRRTWDLLGFSFIFSLLSTHSKNVHFIALIKFIIVLVCTSGNTAEAIFDWKLLKLYLTRGT